MASLLLLLGLGTVTAAAEASVQVADQSADNQQQASSSATSTQDHPSNKNVSVRVFSPGDDGDVEQVNASGAESCACNENATDQRADQSQGGGAGVQQAHQDSSNEQGARSSATSTQIHPSNTNVSVRVFSPGNGGDVKQVNASQATSAAANANTTNQAAGQHQGGGSGVQAAKQKNHSKQDAQSDATSFQDHPSNKNVSVRVDSPGNDGEVKQINESSASSAADNANQTTQSAEQNQPGGRSRSECDGCGSGGGGVQTAIQKNHNEQNAASTATSHQIAPCNCAKSVRVGSPGDDGDVKQINASDAESAAHNSNATEQSATQDQGGGGDVGIQALGQHNSSAQGARSTADSFQDHPRNGYSSLRLDSPGGGGHVVQANLSAAESAAVNDNNTRQVAEQNQATGGIAVQALGQKSENRQDAGSDAYSRQIAPCNCYHPTRVKSGGDDGKVKQANLSFAGSAAINDNHTDQAATQNQYGGGHGSDCGCDPKQDGSAPVPDGSDSQPAEDGSRPDGGDGSQGGDSQSGGDASKSDGEPSCEGSRCGGDGGDASCGGCGASVDGCGCGHGVAIQALGQKVRNGQGARSSAASEQAWASNGAHPLRFKSGGGGGESEQLNGSFGESNAGNGNGTRQGARQADGEAVPV